MKIENKDTLGKLDLFNSPIVDTYLRSTSNVEERNVVNKFKRVTVPKDKYLKFEGNSPVDPEFEHISIAASIDYMKNRHTLNSDDPSVIRYDFRRRNNQGPGIFQNRPAPVSKNGYSSYADENVGKFFFEAFLAAKSIGIVEPKLLINHMLNQPVSQIIYYREDYKRDLPVKKVKDLFKQFLRSCVLKTPLEKIVIKAKKTTSDGPPHMLNGRFYNPEDLLFGVSEDMKDQFYSALRVDYYKAKVSWFNRIEEIYFNQWDFDPHNITPDNFFHYYSNAILICANIGFRLNSIDAVINHEEIKSHKDLMYPKDRRFMFIDKDGVQWGMILALKLLEWCMEYLKLSWGGGPNRQRMIASAGFASNLPSNVLTKMVTTFIEESPNSFASLRPKVLDSYNKFLTTCNIRGNGKFHFINGDRSNAESFVTSNYKQFLELIPDEWLKIYKNQTTVCTFGKSYYTFQGLSSGIAKTTELNWIMGTFEAINAIAKLLKTDVRKIATSYFNCVLKEDDYFIIGDHVIKLFMCTDDIPLVIYGPDLPDIKILGEGTGLMEWKMTFDEMTTFGMHFTPFSLKAAKTSPISKLFYDEHPGFYYKSCFSLVSKFKFLEKEIRDTMDAVYRKFFGHSYTELQNDANYYLSYLQAFGIPLEDIFDKYSPANEILYGDEVNSDPLNQTQTIPQEHYKNVYRHFYDLTKKGYLNSLNN